MPANWRDPLERLQADGQLMCEIANSDHPAANRFTRWLTHELMPALDPFGLRGPPDAGEYEWLSSQSEFEAMLSAAVEVVRPIQ